MKKLLLLVVLGVGLVGGSHAGVVVNVSEINGGADLQFDINGFLDTASLGPAPLVGDFLPDIWRGGVGAGLLGVANNTANGIEQAWPDFLIGGISVVTVGGGLGGLIDPNPFDSGSAVAADFGFLVVPPPGGLLAVDADYVSGAVLNLVGVVSGSNFATFGIAPGDSMTVSWGGGGPGNQFALVAVGAPPAVPEPSTYALFGLMAIGAMVWRRRQQLS